jgi:succinate-semialdehyde dehydrogenase/glutarate-semialdehyde dehydrogenase
MKNPHICGVNFTGSSKSGVHIAEVAGKYLKKSVMELGGNDPLVVLPDCHLQLAVDNATSGRLFNAGQVCFCPKRFIISQEVYEKFKDKLIEKLKVYKFGNPLN